jgi:hypothetical protein
MTKTKKTHNRPGNACAEMKKMMWVHAVSTKDNKNTKAAMHREQNHES